MGTTNKDHTVFILSTFLFFLFPLNYSYTIYNITQSQSLSPGNTLVSPSQIFELGFFSPNQFSNQYIGIWYREISPRTVVWVANRENPLSITDSQATLSINSHGNLEILDRDKKSIWSTISSRVPSNSSSVATLLDNGSLVLKDGSSGAELWNSFDHPGDTALPGSVLGFNLETNKSYLLTSWKSQNDPSPGKFSLGLSMQMPPEAFIWINGSTPYWRSGPWDKLKFIGIPDMYTNYNNDFDLVEDPGKGSTYFHLYGNMVRNLHLSLEGFIQIKEDGEDGVLFTSWQAPQNMCSIYGVCGPFGVCNNLKTPICKCLRGFEPKSVQEWDEGKWERGCMRRKNSVCDEINGGSRAERGKMDGFGKIDNVKPPDFYQFVEGVDNNCSMVCLNNCSCLAYAYVEGIGCLVWSEPLVDIQQFEFGGARLFFRLAHEELVEGHNKIKTIIISVTTILTCGVLGVIAFILHKRGARRNGEPNRAPNVSLHVDSGEPNRAPNVSTLQDSDKQPIFDLRTILNATNDFNQTNKLGQGGFGSVYKGMMSDGSEIAIKRLSSNSGQGIQEFTTELMLIAKLQHRNLVKLLGYCIENEEKILVYEFMPNKSLDSFIFDPTRGKLLNWASRLNIIHGIAKGLVYLHRDSRLRVIHRDLKVSNILLDEKMNPKISDFGLARMFQDTIDLENTKRVVGTLGYMAPEYAIGGVFSEKSDVFSYGVLILEIISGKKNNKFHYRNERLSIIAYAWHLWNENRPLELLDETLAESLYESEVIRCIHIGLLCVQDHAVDRPNMPDVVHMLTNEVNCPQPKPPIFALHSSPIHDSQSQSIHDSQSRSGGKASVNELTMSAVECR